MHRFLIVLWASAALFAQTGNLTINGGVIDLSGAGHTLPEKKGTTAGKPATCTVGEKYFATDATAGQNDFFCTATNTWTQQLNSGAGGASTALDNLSAVNINTSLLAQTGVDAGSTAKPFRNVFLFGAGTYGTTSIELTGTPTAARVWTLLDRSDTVAGLGANAFTGRQDSTGAASTAPMKTGTTLPGTCVVGDTYFKSDVTAGQNIYECQSTNTWTQQLNSGGGASALSAITAASGSNTIANSDNPQIWNWATTTAGRIAMIFGETTASTSTGSPYIVQIKTATGSTAIPLNVLNSPSGSQTLPAMEITPTWNTTGVVDGALRINVTNTASGAASLLAQFKVGGTTQWNVDKAGNSSQAGSGSFGVGSGVAGGIGMTQGTATTPAANSIVLEAPTSVTTAYTINLPGAAGTGLPHYANASNVITETISAVAPADVTSAQGNGTKFQLSTGTTTTNDCVKFDANGNTVDAGAACGSGSGGTAVPPYTQTITAQTSVSITAATHGQGTLATPWCFDGSTPRVAVACGYTRNTSGDLVFTFSPAFTGLIEIGSGGGSSISGLTTNTIPKATSSTTIGNSTVTDDGTTIGLASNFTVTEASGIPAKIAGITTTGLGVPVVGWKSNVTNQSSNQSVTLATAPTAGDYEIHYVVDMNTPCTTGSNSVSFSFSWTDASNARTLGTGSLNFGAAQTTASFMNGIIPLHVGSGNVAYTSTVNGTCATGTSTYDINAWMVRVN